MEETLNQGILNKRIYKERAIWAGTFIGGPLVGGYLIAENFKAFNEESKATLSWIISIILTVIIFIVIFNIPENVKIPNQLIPLLYTGIAYVFVQLFQGKNISTHIDSGGEVYSWKRTIVVSLIGLVVTLSSLIGYFYLSGKTITIEPKTKKYGILNHEIEFDKVNITESEVDYIAEVLTKTSFFDEISTKYVFVKKIDSKYEISISVLEGIEKDNEAIQQYIGLKTDVQKYFHKNKIVINLVEENLGNVAKRIE